MRSQGHLISMRSQKILYWKLVRGCHFGSNETICIFNFIFLYITLFWFFLITFFFIFIYLFFHWQRLATIHVEAFCHSEENTDWPHNSFQKLQEYFFIFFMNLFNKKLINTKTYYNRIQNDGISKLPFFIEFQIDRETVLVLVLTLLVYSHSAKRSANHIALFVELERKWASEICFQMRCTCSWAASNKVFIYFFLRNERS